MKYIKTYEILGDRVSSEKNDETKKKIHLSDKSIWIIYGNRMTQLDVVNKLKKEFGFVLNHDLQKVSINLSGEKNKTIGVVLCYTDKNMFGFYKFKDIKEKDYIVKEYYEEYTLKGELREENGDIVLDTLEADTNKFNL